MHSHDVYLLFLMAFRFQKAGHIQVHQSQLTGLQVSSNLSAFQNLKLLTVWFLASLGKRSG